MAPAAQSKSTPDKRTRRVVSGFRPTGRLHLGHLHGALRNWIRLQHEAECFFFIADWHALTTHYDAPQVIEESVWDMVIVMLLLFSGVLTRVLRPLSQLVINQLGI